MTQPTHARRISIATIAVSATLVMLSARPAWAQEACVPRALGVPYLNGAPNWVDDTTGFGDRMDDPRWRGSFRSDLPAAPTGTGPAQAGFRALHDGDDLYLSFQVFVDPDGPTPQAPGPGGEPVGDTLFMGLDSSDDAPARLLAFRVGTDAEGKAQPPPAVTAVSWAWDESSSAWIGPDPLPFDHDLALWVEATGGTPWSIHVRLDLSEVDGAPFPGPYKFFTAAWIVGHNDGDLVLDAVLPWPDATVLTGDITAADVNGATAPSDWGDLRFETSSEPCTGGIALQWNQIGTTNTPASRIEPTAGATNTFVVNPTWGDETVSAGKIQATFQLADWGSNIGEDAGWTEALGFAQLLDEPTDPSRKDNTNDDDGVIRVECINGDGDRPCPSVNLATQTAHQCMFVQLSTAGPEGATFTRDSAYRNMDFVSASKFDREATISIQGLEALPGQTHRDVYLYVQTRNMPGALERPQELPRREMVSALHDPVMPAPPPQDDVRVHADPSEDQRATEVPPDIPLDQSAFERIAQVWPTYTVHVYHEVRSSPEGEKPVHVRWAPQLPFGYFVDHVGPHFGFEHLIAGLDGVELKPVPGASNLYKLSIANGGRARVKTTILAKEKPDEAIGQPACPGTECAAVCTDCRCSCDVVGRRSGPGGTFWLSLAIVLAILGRRMVRRRRRV